MTTRLPWQSNEWIDRNRPLAFTFEGESFEGYEGDTISSALWAAGLRVLGRSFKYHRPRGILGMTDVDCNVMLEDDSVTNLRGDRTLLREGMRLKAVNTIGGVEHDRLGVMDHFGRFTPVGFYYKAFHKPRWLFPFFENRIRAIAGLGRVNTAKPLRHTAKDYAFCEIVVVGGGPAGLAAALAAAEKTTGVMLIDENPRLGGTLGYQFGASGSNTRQLEELVAQVQAHPNIKVRTGTTVVGLYADQWLAMMDERRLTKLRARAVVVATGCHEQPAVFRNNDLPGVMLASAAQRLIRLYAVKPCRRCVVLAANVDGYRAALDLHAAGVEVAAFIDLRLNAREDLVENLKASGIRALFGYAVLQANGGSSLISADVCALDKNAKPLASETETISCDGIVMSIGWAGADSLLRMAGAKMRYSTEVEQFVPAALPTGVFAAGRVNGIHLLNDQLQDGRCAGMEASHYLDPSKTHLRATANVRIGAVQPSLASRRAPQGERVYRL